MRKLLRLLIARVKTGQIPHVSFETISEFPLEILHHSLSHDT